MVWGLLAASAAQAEEWTYKSGRVADEAFQRWRYSARAGVWVGTFDRPQRACDPSRLFDETLVFRSSFGMVHEQFPGFCPADSSNEVGLSTGVDVSFRAFSPVYLTMGIDLIYTDPGARILKNQLIVAVPFGILLTWYEWTVRPILHATISAVVFVTDTNRDYTMGVSGGVAYRLLDFGDLAITVGRAWSESVDHWTVQLAIHPL